MSPVPPHAAVRYYEHLGGYLLGLWAETVVHANPCDCDLDEEALGDNCASASGARPALLQDQGGFAPTLLMYLPPLGPPPDDPPAGPLWVAEAAAGPGPSSPLEARIPPRRAGGLVSPAGPEAWPPTAGEVQADQEGQA